MSESGRRLAAWPGLLLVALAALSQQAQAGQTYQQHNNIIQFYVNENMPPGTYLGTILSNDGQVPYLVLPSPLTPEHERLAALNISLETGDVSTAAVLDREQREHYHFVALVQKPFAEIKCMVTVKDVNDNAPAFRLAAPPGQANESASYVIEMPENQKNIRRPLPIAYDLDSVPFSIAEFRIVSENTPRELFVLVEQGAPPRSSLTGQQWSGSLADDLNASKVEDPQLAQQLAQQAQVLIPSQAPSPTQLLSQGLAAAQSGRAPTPSARLSAAPPTKLHHIDLELNQPLDRENQSSYQLVVEAHDGGQPALIGKIRVTVNVLDANDNEPQFERKLYEAQLREDAAKGTLVLRVQAHDPDLDQNGQVSYFIKRVLSATQQAKPASQQLFDMEPSKGEIRLAHQLDYETDATHEIIVEARDHGQPSRSGYATLKLSVIDCYEEPPKKAPLSAPSSEASRSDLMSAGRAGPASAGAESAASATGELSAQTFSLFLWFGQLNSSLLFILVLVALFAVAFPLCLVKMKIHQPESESNDTAGLTLASNNGQIKPSPNHSISNDHHSNVTVANDYRYHESQRRSDSQLAAVGLAATQASYPTSPAPIKLRYSYTDISNSYENLVYAPDLYAFYNMDYLADWAPEYQSVMALLQSDYALNYRQAAR